MWEMEIDRCEIKMEMRWVEVREVDGEDVRDRD